MGRRFYPCITLLWAFLLVPRKIIYLFKTEKAKYTLIENEIVIKNRKTEIEITEIFVLLSYDLMHISLSIFFTGILIIFNDFFLSKLQNTNFTSLSRSLA